MNFISSGKLSTGSAIHRGFGQVFTSIFWSVCVCTVLYPRYEINFVTVCLFPENIFLLQPQNKREQLKPQEIFLFNAYLFPVLSRSIIVYANPEEVQVDRNGDVIIK